MFLLKNNKFNFKITVVSLVLMSTVIFLLPLFSSAQILVPQVDNLGTADLKTVVGTIIQIFLGLLGLIALVIILYGGFIWMTSGGNEEKISKAKKILTSGVIGLLIILSSYVIASFILEDIQNSLNSNGGGGGGGGFGGGLGGGALGGGVIEYHYPNRNANNIPRNTLIMITFKTEVATSSVIGNSFTSNPGMGLCNNYTANNTNGNECGKLSSDIKIFDDGEDISTEGVVAVLQADGKNVLLRPINNLGNSQNSTFTNVNLGSSMLSAEGDALFGVNGYSWRFEVSTFLDETPPTIDFVWPEENANDVFRNAIIQINFSEPINLLSVNEDTVSIVGTDGALSGSLKISNQYQTVEFLSNMDCGGGNPINSCGTNVFCLPAEDTIISKIFAGNATNPLSGISDAAGNMFDGNANGEENYSPDDDKEWSFHTNDEVYLTPPRIVSVNPSNNQENIQLRPSPYISALFTLELNVSGNISPDSLTSDVFYVYDHDFCIDPHEGTSLAGNKEEIRERVNTSKNDCFPSYSTQMSEGNKRCNIQIYSNLKNITNYRPRITSELKDSYGNCFNPSEDEAGNSGQQ